MIRNEKIAETRADEAEARAEARMLAERASMAEAHAEGMHDEPREFCPECEAQERRRSA